MKFSRFTLLVVMSYVAASAGAPASSPPLETKQIVPEALRNPPRNPSWRDFEREIDIDFDPAVARDSYARRNIDAVQARERLEILRQGRGVSERDVREGIEEAWID